jgi:biopolymer transport protein ExbD
MEREIHQINVIPLVDVMLVLLVIVLTTATFITTGQIPVQLAKAKEAGDRKDVPLVITMTSEGNLFINDTPIPPNGLKSAMAPHPRESSVLVRADKVTILERFVLVVDEVRGLGFQQVNLEVVRS